MHTQFKMAIIKQFNMYGIVQVLGIRTVNGKRHFLTQIHSPNQIFVCWCIGHSIGFRKHIIWKVRHDVHRFQDLQDINPHIALMSHNITHLTDKIIVATRWVLVNIYLDNLSSVQDHGLFFDVNFLLDFLVFRFDVTSIFWLFIIEDKFPHNSLQAAFHNANNFSFSSCSFQTVSRLFNDCLNRIPINRIANIIATDKHIVFILING